ncbi:unnamed protein product, partial [Symbiodinium natans]
QLSFLKILGDVLEACRHGAVCRDNDRIGFKQAVDRARMISANSVFNSKIRRAVASPPGPGLSPTEQQVKQDRTSSRPKQKGPHGPVLLPTPPVREMNTITEAEMEEDQSVENIDKLLDKMPDKSDKQRAASYRDMGTQDVEEVLRPRSTGDLPAYDPEDDDDDEESIRPDQLEDENEEEEEDRPPLSPGTSSEDGQGSPFLPVLITSHDGLAEGSGAMSPVLAEAAMSAASCPLHNLRGQRPRPPASCTSPEPPPVKQVSFRMCGNAEESSKHTEAEPSRPRRPSQGPSSSCQKKPPVLPWPASGSGSEADDVQAMSASSEPTHCKSLQGKSTAETLSSGGSNVPPPKTETAPPIPATDSQALGIANEDLVCCDADERNALQSSVERPTVKLPTASGRSIVPASGPTARARDEQPEMVAMPPESPRPLRFLSRSRLFNFRRG